MIVNYRDKNTHFEAIVLGADLDLGLAPFDYPSYFELWLHHFRNEVSAGFESTGQGKICLDAVISCGQRSGELGYTIDRCSRSNLNTTIREDHLPSIWNNARACANRGSEGYRLVGYCWIWGCDKGGDTADALAPHDPHAGRAAREHQIRFATVHIRVHQ